MTDRPPRYTAYALGAILLLMGAMKFMDPAMTRGQFAGWGYPAWFGFVTGGLEIVAAGSLFLARTRLAGGALAVVILVGAAATHLRVPEVGLLPIGLPMLAAAAYVAWSARPATSAPAAASA